MSPLQIRAAGYVRQSRARENKSEASPATQREANRARADQFGATWVGSYEDIGISAFSGAERPGFERLIADCRSGRVNTIIVYYVSRFSRQEVTDAIPIVSELLGLGVTIISVTEGEFRKGNLMDLIHLLMRLDAAHSESKNKSAAVKGAKAAARALGGYVSGKPPYGFALASEIRHNTDGRPIAIKTLAVREAEAAVIRRMVARVLDPTDPPTLVTVAAELNRDQVPTRGGTVGKNTAGSAWWGHTLARILRDPRIAGYAAEIVYATRPNGTPSGNVAGYRLVRDDDGKPVPAHPEIIDPATWYALQTALDGRAGVAPVPTGVQALLSSLGILRCECGAIMKSHRIAARAARSAYRCARPRGLRRPGQHANDCTVSMEALDDYVARRIFALISTADTGEDPETLDALAEAARLFGIASTDPATAAQRGAIAGELDDAERALDNLYDDREKGGYSGKVGQRRFLDAERALSARIDALTGQLAALDAAASPLLPIVEWLGEPGEDPIGPGSWWARAPIAERRAFVALFVREITVRKAPDGMTRPPIDSRAEIAWVRPLEDQ
ncbi:recombinase family protein [Micromonospora sp. NBC_00898]|uniref:recombinase family protein n=1 Tax=Micromonospora sp. NBC_00898 TaxID=2975981 RepID=UPI00386B0670|nr:recombinase family protein [Micromonospora sp. NBC_00898]